MDELKNNILIEVNRRRGTLGDLCTDGNETGPDGWSEITYNLDLARNNAAIGLSLPPMHTLKGIKRQLAVYIGKIVLRIGQVFTRDQRMVNQSLIEAVELLKIKLTEDLRQQSENIQAYMREAGQLKSQIIAQERRLSLLLEETRKRLPEPFDNNQLVKMAAELKDINDNWYLNFEDKFRGSRADIVDRLRIYLPVIREAQAGAADRPVLDIGCGRGEWLELLREESCEAKGIDLNQASIELCRKLGLDATCAEAIAFLQTIPEESLGAVTAFHVVEHLTVDLLFRLIDEILRVLKPGGVAIFETPNPQNIIVGACNFYLDQTHQKPIPPAALQFIVEARGFCRVKVLKMQPFPKEMLLPEEDSEIAKRFNEYFYGPQDYAVVGWKA